MDDFASSDIRIVLRPDRRQEDERRSRHRGGRRASDQAAFALSSSADAADIWHDTDRLQWGQGPHKAYVH